MVLTCSHWISRVLWYSGYPPSEIDFAYKAITLFRPVFQRCSAIDSLNYAGPKPHRNKFLRFGLFRFRSPLLTKSLFYFLFLRVLRCFSSPGSLHPHYVFTVALPTVGFPIRKSADRGLFAAPRSLSQLVTSFFGAWCQGIHPMPLLALILTLTLRHIANVLVKFLNKISS